MADLSASLSKRRRRRRLKKCIPVTVCAALKWCFFLFPTAAAAAAADKKGWSGNFFAAPERHAHPHNVLQSLYFLFFFVLKTKVRVDRPKC
jgi:hypothetical protein